MNISVVITSYEGIELLRRYLPSVVAACKEYGLAKTEIIVSDDSSSDGTDTFLRAEYPFVKIVRSRENCGFSVTANSGIFAAQYNHVVLINTDVELHKNCFNFLPEHFKKPLVFAVRPGLSENPGGALERYPRIGGHFRFGSFAVPAPARDDLGFAFHAGDGLSAYDREKFIELGGFDEMFSPFYCEDTDLSYRAWKRGWQVIYEPRALAYHQSGATISRFYPLRYVQSIVERNRFFLMWKNITDRRMIAQHLFFLPARLFGSVLKGNFVPLMGFFLALKYLKEVLAKRRLERQFLLISDRDIFNLFDS